jgi:type I restriction enzyme, S subunit
MDMAKPIIRFKGYQDDWEQRKLGEIITEYKETVDSECTLPILTSSKTEGVILQEEHFGRKQQHDITGYNILPRNYCTYRNRSDGVDFTFNINKCCDKGIISKFYPVFSGKNSDVFFLSLVLNNSDEVVREIAYTCTGTGQKVLSFLDLQKMKVRVPSYDEQKEIAAYFENLDYLITLHQRKCDETKKLKKYMLQKMFPQNGEKVPEIRFSGFTDDWEQRKLSEIALQTYGGGTPKTANEEFWKGNIPWIQSSDLLEERLFNVKPRKYISQEAISKSSTKLVPQNSIAIVTRVGVGKLAFMPFSYATSQDFLSLSELKIEPEFAVYALYKMMRLVSNEVQGTSIKGITKDELLAKEILIPDCEEQKKIGAYLHNLDDLITLHQRELESLQNIKKFMLEKMFV